MSVISQSDFDALMEACQLPLNCSLAVGVSGGADSLFLTLFLNDWALRNNHPLTALTVNHNLRPEAAQEAESVHTFLTRRGIEHHILTWQGEKPLSRIEERAREMRYQLLGDFCVSHQITCLCLAHHLEDQAETFLARLARGSGLDGLSAMPKITKRGDISLVRPLLGVQKQQIVDTLTHLKVSWAEDPMNRDTASERVRWRTYLPKLKEMGLKTDSMTLSVSRLNRAKTALDFYTNSFLSAHTIVDERGFALISTEPFKRAPEEIRLRVLSRLIAQIGQAPKPVSLDSLEQVCQLPLKRRTLGWCHIIPHRSGIFIAKEQLRQEAKKHIPAQTWSRWDRFMIWADRDVVVHSGGGKKKDPDIPFLVQQSFVVIEDEKRLEKKSKLDYNHNTSHMETHVRFILKKG